MDTLLSNINDRVNVMVKEYVNEVLQRVSVAHNIPIDQLKKHLESNEPTPFVKKINPVVESDSVLCSMKTKSGTQCKYKSMSGMDVCKKHHKLQHEAPLKPKKPIELKKRATKPPVVVPVTTSQLPSEEQSWFDEAATYEQSYYPDPPNNVFMASQDSQIVDDTQGESAYVLDE